MKWRSLVFPVILVIVIGVVAGILSNLYFYHHPVYIADKQEAYTVLRDAITVVIAVLTLFTAILIAIVGWALRGILFNDLKAELSEVTEESRNILCGDLHRKVAPLWGRLFEYDKESTYLIEYAIAEARQGLDYANKLDEKKHWRLHIEARNNYLMAMAERGDPGDANEAYKISVELERKLTDCEKELEPTIYQGRRETVYFARCRLPRINSNDKKEALKGFNSLSDAPRFKKWQERWIAFKLIKGTSPDK